MSQQREASTSVENGGRSEGGSVQTPFGEVSLIFNQSFAVVTSNELSFHVTLLRPNELSFDDTVLRSDQLSFDDTLLGPDQLSFDDTLLRSDQLSFGNIFPHSDEQSLYYLTSL